MRIFHKEQDIDGYMITGGICSTKCREMFLDNSGIESGICQRGGLAKVNQAMRTLMQDEIQKECQEAVTEAICTAAKNVMMICGWDARQAMDSLGIPEEDQSRYLQILQ